MIKVLSATETIYLTYWFKRYRGSLVDYSTDVAMIYTSKSTLFVSKGGTLQLTTGQMSGVMTANKKKCIYTHTYISTSHGPVHLQEMYLPY